LSKNNLKLSGKFEQLFNHNRNTIVGMWQRN